LLFSDTKSLSENIASLEGIALSNELDVLASRLITPYIIMAVILAGVSVAILKAKLPEISPEEEATEVNRRTTKEKNSILQFPHLILGVICIFVYVGVEVIAIDTIGLYGEFHGFDLITASKFGIYCLIALTIGYLLAIVLIPKVISQKTSLIVSALMGIAFII